MQATSDRGGSDEEEIAASTDAEGYAEIRVFPMNYYYRVAADGYNGESGNVRIQRESLPDEQRVTLYAVIRGSVRVAWISRQGDAKTTSDVVIQIGDQRPSSLRVTAPTPRPGFARFR